MKKTKSLNRTSTGIDLKIIQKNRMKLKLMQKCASQATLSGFLKNQQENVQKLLSKNTNKFR